ncbi:MAG TPA: response regulator [Vicinamibacterales bacterium]|nr:response regulator [Vicinamibacterales bacterium]
MPEVLVVDDEPLIRWSLSEGLTENGYGVRLAGNAAEARAALALIGQQPLVVLLDLRLPDVVDLSLLAEIRRRWPGAKVVMMSAHGTADDMTRATELGAVSFVEKPFDVTEVVRIVGEAWGSPT